MRKATNTTTARTLNESRTLSNDKHTDAPLSPPPLGELPIDDNVVVTMHYQLSNGFGEIIDSSQGQLAMVYMHNTAALLPSLERELTGRRSGEVVEVVIYPEDGYDYPDESLIQALPREQFAGIKDLAEGQRIRARLGKGPADSAEEEARMMTVKEIRENEVVVDMNHPLAGQVLHFLINIVDVREPSEEELANGYADSAKIG